VRSKFRRFRLVPGFYHFHQVKPAHDLQRSHVLFLFLYHDRDHDLHSYQIRDRLFPAKTHDPKEQLMVAGVRVRCCFPFCSPAQRNFRSKDRRTGWAVDVKSLDRCSPNHKARVHRMHFCSKLSPLPTPDLSFGMDWALSVWRMKSNGREILLVYQEISGNAQYDSKDTHFRFNRLLKAASASSSENSNSSSAGSSS
jgi:hypothetical protein